MKSKGNGLSHPHDRLFKSLMQKKEIATDFFRAHLPATTLAKMDLSTIEPIRNDHILDGLELLYSDFVCRCRIKDNPGYILLTAEHQSTPDEMMAFRMHHYEVNIMMNHWRQYKEKLPIVLSVLLYHGKRSPYPYSTDIFDCFKDPKLAKELALKEFYLTDLTTIEDKEIVLHELATLMELLFKHYRDERLLSWWNIVEQHNLLAIMKRKFGKNILLAVLKY